MRIMGEAKFHGAKDRNKDEGRWGLKESLTAERLIRLPSA